MISMPQALPYYAPLIESRGYAKAMDLLGYRWDVQATPRAHARGDRADTRRARA